MRNDFVYFTLVSLAVIALLGYLWYPFWYLLVPLTPILLLGWYDMIQGKHAIMRNFPVLGRGRYIMEVLRPKMYQYFVESDIDGRPFSRTQRSVVYQRAKKELDTAAFGTQLDVYEQGYEWMNHSIGSLDPHHINQNPRIIVGGPDCKQPYNASVYNVSAMSFGSLSINAVLALNGAAKLGGFAHNTGEGGISPHHLSQGGDLIYQVGTGYFGSRSKDGKFSPEEFAKRANLPQVKMIELKLSQGAKPGHGGILPAKKNTPEIAQIRGVEPYTQVLSPPYHTAFSTPTQMMQLIGQMRQLSGGKPIGFKLCIGSKYEFFAICKAMIQTGITPDFITVDGGEGGTGAAPIEFSDSVGMPFKEGLAFVHDALTGFGLRQHIKIFTAGKIITAYHLSMMMALGCIQALECNKNTCPTGVATQDPELVKGLVVEDKRARVASFHKETVKCFVELLAAAGLDNPQKINRSMINRRVNMRNVLRYDEIYPYIPANCLLQAQTVPEHYRQDWERANPNSFLADTNQTPTA